jgi:hypothetical protein
MPRRRTLIASAVAALAAPRAGMTQEAAGRVARLVGSGLLLRGGGSQPLAEGAALFLGDVVRTGLAAKVQIDCPDGLVVVVGPESEVRISDFSRGRGLYSVELMLELLAGIVRLVGPAQAAPRRVDVLTRSALASVRSTDWLVTLTPTGTGVFSREGRVEVSGVAGGTVFLEAGEGTDVALGTPPTPPRRWGDTRRDEALARTTL